MTIVATILIIGVVIAIGWRIERRLVPKPAELATGKPKVVSVGATPATAIRAKPAQLERLRTTQRCSACRGTMTADLDDEAIRYDDRRLIVLHFACPDCGQNRSLYVEPTA